MIGTIHISSKVDVPLTELRFTFARSGGKGGQNVNKVETKVELYFDVLNSPNFTDDERDLICKHLKSHLDADGVLRIVSQKSRSQWKNREEAVRKFVSMLQHALKPKKKRVATKISIGGKEKRLMQKKRRGETKKMRRVETDS